MKKNLKTLLVDRENIILSKKLKSKELAFLSYILRTIYKNGSFAQKIKFSSIFLKTPLKTREDIVDLILNLSTINLFHNIPKPSNKTISISFFDKVSMDEENLTVVLSKCFITKYFFSLDTTKEKFLNSLLFFKDQDLTLYYLLTSAFNLEEEVILPLDHIKKSLGYEDRYPRFNDFMSKVLKPSLENINNITFLNFKVKKIKTPEYKKALLFSMESQRNPSLFPLYNESFLYLHSSSIFKNYIDWSLRSKTKEEFQFLLKSVEENLESNLHLSFIKSLNKLKPSETADFSIDEIIFSEVKSNISKLSYLSWIATSLLKLDLNINFNNISIKILNTLRKSDSFSFLFKDILVEGSYINKKGSLSILRTRKPNPMLNL